MTEPESSIISEFPPATRAQWDAKVGQPPKTETVEGPTIEALYTRDSAMVGPRPPARAPGWTAALPYGAPSAEGLARCLAEDAERGVAASWVELAAPLRAGFGDAAGSGGTVLGPGDLPRVFEALGRGRGLVLNAGVHAPLLVDTWLADTERPQTDALLCDPLAELSGAGGLGCSLADAYAGLAHTTRATASRGLPTVLLDAVTVHDAGASAEQEVAVAIAAGIEHMQRLGTAGLEPGQWVPQAVLRMATGGDLLIDMAKLRAARRLWAAVCRRAGLDDASVSRPLWVRTSWRQATARDPWVNMLRATVGAFAAAVAGAASIAVAPFTEALGPADASARRWAINTQHILLGESHLGAVDDPGAGSYAVEALTEQLARGAWAQVQRWLDAGGLAAVIERGQLAAEVAERAAARSTALATGKLAATGTTQYPHLEERRPTVAPAPALDSGVDASVVVTAPPLRRRRLTEPFEQLRDAAEAHASDDRPSVAIAVVGDANRARPQIDFARNVASVGGFAVTVEPADAAAKQPAALFIVCGHPDALAESGPAAVRALAPRGRVLVAGRPTDPLRDAGAHDFVHRGRDVVAMLSALHGELGITRAKETTR